MKDAKHTPGPWFVDQYGHLYGSHTIPTKFKNGLKAPHLAQFGKDATSIDKRLMQLAPEMLKALGEAHELMSKLVESGKHKSWPIGWGRIFAKMTIILDKAKGE